MHRWRIRSHIIIALGGGSVGFLLPLPMLISIVLIPCAARGRLRSGFMRV